MEKPPPPEFPATPPVGPPLPPVPPDDLRPPPVWPSTEPEPSPPRPPAWVVVAAILAVVALVVALFAVFIDDDEGAVDAADAPTTTAADEETDSDDEESPPTTASEADEPEAFDAVVDDITAFVERERGLTFVEDVTVELADEEEFQARLLADFEEDTADLAAAGEVLIALGLIEPDVDVVAAVRELLGASVVGFYDPETNELVVRGTATTPYVRQTIAHELTHALQDQHFELDRPELDETDDEQGFGFTSLVEGDAERVAIAYEATLSEAEQDEALQEELRLSLGFDVAAVPFVLIEQLSLPYLLGPDLIAEILGAGGQESLDASFTAPPTTSEHLLDPETFVLGDPPNPVTEPQADGEVIDRGVLGLLGLTELAGESPLLGIDGISDELAGWGGDRYVAWRDGDRTCIRVAVLGETIQDTDQYEALLAEVAADPPGGVEATATRGEGELDPVVYTSCG
jgi:Putative metallopeptidase family (DUF6782)